VDGDAPGLTDNSNGEQASTPLFIVAGTCPNGFCGMQAVLFSQVHDQVDFWWIKPQNNDPARLEDNTLRLHSKGPFKNGPGKARSLYAPLAEKFSVGHDGDFIFGVDSIGRAFIEEGAGDGGGRMRMLIYLIWQESWSSALAYKKFIRGKICYQKGMPDKPGPKEGKAAHLFARQYEIRDGQITIATRSEEESVASLLPPDSFQEMFPNLD